jgi:hypothetical protein
LGNLKLIATCLILSIEHILPGIQVEIGQPAFVANVLLSGWLLHRMKSLPLKPVQIAVTYAIGSIAAYWMIERVAGFWM